MNSKQSIICQVELRQRRMLRKALFVKLNLGKEEQVYTLKTWNIHYVKT
jgi:hypothetical protein